MRPCFRRDDRRPETRPMAHMANDLSKNSRVYERLSFPLYDCDCPRLDTEWLLSTLFDASLLSTSKAAGNGGSFFAFGKAFSSEVGTGSRQENASKQELVLPCAGNHKSGCRWTLADTSAMISSS